MNTPTLLPCPFCGESAILDVIQKVSFVDHKTTERAMCSCTVCHSGTPSSSADEAVALWNKRRHPERALVAYLQRGATLRAIDPDKPIVLEDGTIANLDVSYPEKK